MNAARRARLTEVREKLTELICELEDISTEENEAYENLPDSIRESERGEKMEQNADTLNNVQCDLESIADTLDEILE